MVDDYFIEHFLLILNLFCFQVLSRETQAAGNWEFGLAVRALHYPLLSQVHQHELTPFELLSMLLDNCYFDNRFPVVMKFMNLSISVCFRNHASQMSALADLMIFASLSLYKDNPNPSRFGALQIVAYLLQLDQHQMVYLKLDVIVCCYLEDNSHFL